MKIKDLPQHLQQLALKEAELQGRHDVTIETDLANAFQWCAATQPFDDYWIHNLEFWRDVNNRSFNTEEL